MAQLEDAMQGLSVETRQRETGVKDALSQRWINLSTEKRASLESTNGKDDEEKTDAEIHSWLGLQSDVTNPFLDLPGGLFINASGLNSSYACRI